MTEPTAEQLKAAQEYLATNFRGRGWDGVDAAHLAAVFVRREQALLDRVDDLEKRQRGFLEDRALVEPLVQQAADYQKRIEELEREVERLKQTLTPYEGPHVTMTVERAAELEAAEAHLQGRCPRLETSGAICTTCKSHE